ncbi:MAG: ABC transporter ATP-binding protein [Ostreibacterium sp.]
MTTLELKKITKQFDKVDVIKGIDLKIEDKEFVVFVGPSGCGKSTILRMIAGLDEISSGQILINNKNVNALPPVKRGISMVFQSYALYPHMTVYDNIAFPLQIKKIPKNEIKTRVEDVAKILQLTERLQYKPGLLSGGQRQRVAIGRAIIRKPDIFLFDEPLSNLDASLRSDMRVELAQLHHTLQATMIYVTHDQIEAMTMASKIVVLRHGIIEQVGSPMTLYHHPNNLFVAEFIGNQRMNFLSGTLRKPDSKNTTITIDNMGDITLPIDTSGAKKGSKITLGLRPEHTSLIKSNNKLTLKIDVLEKLGSHTVIYSTFNTKKFSAILEGSVAIKNGQDIELFFDKNNGYLFDEKGKAFKRLKSSTVFEFEKNLNDQ